MNGIVIIQLLFLLVQLVLLGFFGLIVFAIVRAQKRTKIPLPLAWIFLLIATFVCILLSMAIVFIVQ